MQQDAIIAPPAAKNIAQQKPRLTIDIDKNGQLKHDGRNITDAQLLQLSKKFHTDNPGGVLKLRAHKGTDFKHIRSAIRTTAKGGLNQVVFSVYKQSKDEPHAHHEFTENDIKKHEADLKMSLPVTPKVNEAPPALTPMFIKIDKIGSIFINSGAAQEKLDHDVNNRNLPLLSERLKTYAAAARTGGINPTVKIWADPATKQQRLIDVLNTLASEKISSVTFTDIIDK